MIKKTIKFILIILMLAFLCLFIYKLAVKIYCPIKYSEYVETYCDKYGLEKDLVYSVINAESRFNPNAVSKKGAKGLMQIMDTTATWSLNKMGMRISQDDIFDPEININIGCWYLKYLTDKYDDTFLALCAYNAGSGNVSKWLENEQYSKDGTTLYKIPYKQTENYVKKIEVYRKIYKKLLR